MPNSTIHSGSAGRLWRLRSTSAYRLVRAAILAPVRCSHMACRTRRVQAVEVGQQITDHVFDFMFMIHGSCTRMFDFLFGNVGWGRRS
jgi:hypothetical protein